MWGKAGWWAKSLGQASSWPCCPAEPALLLTAHGLRGLSPMSVIGVACHSGHQAAESCPGNCSLTALVSSVLPLCVFMGLSLCVCSPALPSANSGPRRQELRDSAGVTPCTFCSRLCTLGSAPRLL